MKNKRVTRTMKTMMKRMKRRTNRPTLFNIDFRVTEIPE
jgi:hypothetical protein